MAVSDINSDGRSDLIVDDRLLFGDGHGRFTSRRLAHGAYGVGSGDLDRDGTRDLVAFDQRGIDVALGTGRGQFAPPTPFGTQISADSGFQDAPSIAELNSDATRDVLANATFAGLTFFSGDGRGGLSDPTVVPIGGAFDGASYEKVEDVNGDGVPDVVLLAPHFRWCDAAEYDTLQVFLGGKPTARASAARLSVTPSQAVAGQRTCFNAAAP